MIVILAETEHEAELEALERGFPPRGRDVMLLATKSPGAARKVRGLMLERRDVIEADSALRGKFYGEIRRALEPAFVL